MYTSYYMNLPKANLNLYQYCRQCDGDLLNQKGLSFHPTYELTSQPAALCIYLYLCLYTVYVNIYLYVVCVCVCVKNQTQRHFITHYQISSQNNSFSLPILDPNSLRQYGTDCTCTCNKMHYMIVTPKLGKVLVISSPPGRSFIIILEFIQ